MAARDAELKWLLRCLERKWYNVAMARSPWTIYPRPRTQPRRLTWRSVIVSLFTLLGRFVGDLATGRSSRAADSVTGALQ